MKLGTKRAIAATLALSAALVGTWAGLAPRSFHEDFPLPGRHWVSAMGPYNEHLVRDVGTLYLSLLVVSAWSAIRGEALRMTGAAWLVFAVPHLTFHLAHLHAFAMIDVVGQVVTLGGTVVLAALLLAPEHDGLTERAPAPAR